MEEEGQYSAESAVRQTPGMASRPLDGRIGFALNVPPSPLGPMPPDFLSDLAEYDPTDAGDTCDVVTPPILTAVHHALGVRPGRVLSLLARRESGKPEEGDPKERKAAWEVGLIRAAAAEVLASAQGSRDFGLVTEREDGERGYEPVGPERVAFLREKMMSMPWEHRVNVLAGLTAESLALVCEGVLDRFLRQRPEAAQKLQALTRECNEESVSLQPDMRENMASAIANSELFSWSLLARIPDLFRRDVGRDPTREECGRVAAGSVSTLELLSSSEFHVFKWVQDRLREHGPRKRMGDTFSPDLLALHRVGDEPRIVIRRAVFAGISPETAETGPSEIRAGCSALLARVEDGRSALRALFEWKLPMADAFLFSRPDRDGERRRRKSH